jgi:hypothetical protein
VARLASEHNLPLKVNYNGNWGYHIQLSQSKIHISESDLPPVFVQVSNCYPFFLNMFFGVIQLDNVANSNSLGFLEIIISCKHKRELYMELRCSKNSSIKKIKRFSIKYFQKL